MLTTIKPMTKKQYQKHPKTIVKKEINNWRQEIRYYLLGMNKELDLEEFIEKLLESQKQEFSKLMADSFLELKEENKESLRIQKQGLLDYIETLIAGEMLIAHKENQPTSRLTSLLTKIKSKLNAKD